MRRLRESHKTAYEAFIALESTEKLVVATTETSLVANYPESADEFRDIMTELVTLCSSEQIVSLVVIQKEQRFAVLDNKIWPESTIAFYQ
jgi:hypothetical protein